MRRTTMIVFAASLAMLVATTAAFAGGPKGHTLFRYVGQLQSTSGTALTVTVQNGNRPALRSLLGQSQVQTFATGERTVFLKWTHGVPAVVGIGDLAAGDYVTVNVRAARKASLETVRGTPAAIVGDHGPTVTAPARPLFLFRGTFVSTADGKVTLDVKGGNHHALKLLIGQSNQQAFTTGPDTVFLHWAHRIPTLIGPSGLVVGDRIVIRIRADKGSSLAEVLATAAKRVADREPKAQEQSQNAQA